MLALNLEKSFKSQTIEYVLDRLTSDYVDDTDLILEKASKVLKMSEKEIINTIKNDTPDTMEYHIYETILEIIDIDPEIIFE